MIRRQTLTDVCGLGLLAITIRLGIGYGFPGMVFFDEIYQILEPAHFRAFGTGFMPWEYYLGIRSWLVPMLFAPMMQAAAWFSNNPDIILFPIRLFLAALSSVTVVVAYGFGRRYYDRKAALVIGIIMAAWSEQIYFATHPLTEIMATPVLLLALYLGDGLVRAMKTDQKAQTWKFFAVGLLFGLVFMLRFHLVIAMMAAGVWLVVTMAQKNLLKRVLPLIGGGGIMLLAAAWFDGVTLGTPLQSVWLNAIVNLQDGISSGFGTEPPWDIFDLVWRYWLLLTPFMAGLVWLGWRRSPMLAVAAVAVLLTHTIIAHKEQRFIFPAITILSLLASFGLIEGCRLVAQIKTTPDKNKYSLALPLGIGLAMSLAITLLVNFSGHTSLWYNGRFFNRMFAKISNLGEPPCGLALDHNLTFFITPAQSGLSPTIRLYTPDNFQSLLNHSAAYDGILSDQIAGMRGLSERGYEQKFCTVSKKTGDRVMKAFPPPNPTCFYQRPGVCELSYAPLHVDGLIGLVKPNRWRYGQRDLFIKLGIPLPAGMSPPPAQK